MGNDTNIVGRPTDHRNLDLAKLNSDVVFGRAGGKVIWQPRILCWWQDRQWDGRGAGPYQGGSVADMYRSLGCSDRVYHYTACVVPVHSPKMTWRSEELDGNRVKTIAETPVGTAFHVARKTDTSWATITEKEWITTPEEMKVWTWMLENAEWRWRQDTYDQLQREVGDLGAPQLIMPRVNVQDLYVNSMGVEGAVYAIYEWGSVVDDYFRALHENHLRMIDVINASPIEIVNFGDNIHGGVLSPALYEEYVLPAYLERCDKLHKAGKFVNSHWDGDVKPLLKYAKCSGLDGIEAITPLPQGDVTLDEAKEALGDDIYLLDGIPAVYFDETFPIEVLEECVHRLIELFAPKLVLGISDEMSSQGDIERIRVVGRIVDDYNAGLAAE
jgi:hypothetical protein